MTHLASNTVTWMQRCGTLQAPSLQKPISSILNLENESVKSQKLLGSTLHQLRVKSEDYIFIFMDSIAQWSIFWENSIVYGKAFVCPIKMKFSGKLLGSRLDQSLEVWHLWFHVFS